MKYEKMIMDQLHKKPTFEGLINYIDHQPKIKYPDRRATFLRNSHILGQFDGDSLIDLEEQENKILKEKLIQEALKTMAKDKGMTHSVLKYRMDDGRTTPRDASPDKSINGSMEDAYNELDEAQQKMRLEERVRQHMINERLKANLQEVKSQSEKTFGAGSDYASVASAPMTLQDLLSYWAPATNDTPPSTPRNEQASSSTSKPVYPTGLNAAPLAEPKRRGRTPGSKNKPKDKTTMQRLLYGD